MAPGFERVRAAFGGNFEHGDDVGAALCVYQHGRKVADLWGGMADSGTGRRWTRDTLQLVYSATKIAFGYVVSHIRQDMSDTRAATLVSAVRACVVD